MNSTSFGIKRISILNIYVFKLNCGRKNKLLLKLSKSKKSDVFQVSFFLDLTTKHLYFIHCPFFSTANLLD